MKVMFDWCVDLLSWLSALFGVTYETVNVVLFLIVYPAGIIVMALIWLHDRRKFKRFREEFRDAIEQSMPEYSERKQ